MESLSSLPSVSELVTRAHDALLDGSLRVVPEEQNRWRLLAACALANMCALLDALAREAGCGCHASTIVLLRAHEEAFGAALYLAHGRDEAMRYLYGATLATWTAVQTELANGAGVADPSFTNGLSDRITELSAIAASPAKPYSHKHVLGRVRALTSQAPSGEVNLQLTYSLGYRTHSMTAHPTSDALEAYIDADHGLLGVRLEPRFARPELLEYAVLNTLIGAERVLEALGLQHAWYSERLAETFELLRATYEGT